MPGLLSTLRKAEGGLGLKDASVWNKALILKHLISIVKPLSGSLWVEWVRKTVIKDKSFWIISKPRKCSWILKKVLDLRVLAIQHISYSIGNGHHTSLWFDPWHNGTPLCSNATDLIISHSGLNSSSKVSSILSASGWVLPSLNYHDLLNWRQKFQHTPYNLLKEDDINWDGIASKKFKVSDLWGTVRHIGCLTPWASNVWHKLGVPRYSFLHWLIMHGRVNTLSKLLVFGTATNDSCYFCINAAETVHHLFLECPYFQHLLRLLTKGICSPFPSVWLTWQQELNGFQKNDIHTSIKVLIFQTACYTIWKERNNMFHLAKSTSMSHMSHSCAHLVKCILLSSKWYLKECI